MITAPTHARRPCRPLSTERWRAGAALALAVASALPSPAVRADAAYDEQALRLARRSGCTACHSLDPVPRGADTRPAIGPAWREVAMVYRGDAQAATRLTQTVLKGSSPHDSHWRGKAAGMAMPPQAVALTAAEARTLVDWILQLPSAGP